MSAGTSNEMSVLEFLYRFSLESPYRWGVFLGSTAGLGKPMDFTLYMFLSFVSGLRLAASDERNAEFQAFFEWLRDVRGELPPDYPEYYLELCGGSHRRAIARYLSFVREYARTRELPWFAEINASPTPSMIYNGLGNPVHPDVRDPNDEVLIEE